MRPAITDEDVARAFEQVKAEQEELSAIRAFTAWLMRQGAQDAQRSIAGQQQHHQAGATLKELRIALLAPQSREQLPWPLFFGVSHDFAFKI